MVPKFIRRGELLQVLPPDYHDSLMGFRLVRLEPRQEQMRRWLAYRVMIAIF